MKKSFGMWMTIICILVVGISVTKATRKFVSSNSRKTVLAETAVPAENTALTENISDIPVFAGGSGQEEDAEGSVAEQEEGASLETAVSGRSIVRDEAAKEETVKSPLDPAVDSDGAYIEAAEDWIQISSDDFLVRFETAENTAKSFWENAASDNSSGQTAAEQEYLLWDYELNLVYGAIRERMSQDEADELKALELEWMRERDTYADKALAANKGISTRSPEYLKRMTEKTKERCYWLADQYGTVLDRDIAAKTK